MLNINGKGINVRDHNRFTERITNIYLSIPILESLITGKRGRGGREREREKEKTERERSSSSNSSVDQRRNRASTTASLLRRAGKLKTKS